MRFKIVTMDPSWDYPDNANNKKTKDFHSYPKMTLSEMAALPVPDLLDPSGVLFSWYTGPMAKDALILMESWDLKVVNFFCFIWIKLNPNTVMIEITDLAPFNDRGWLVDGDFFSYGAGGYSMTNVEAVLVARPRKKAPMIERVNASQRQLVFDNIGRRSRKPEEVQDRIERMFGMRERGIQGVELFATRERDGWRCLGNEIPGDSRDIRESLPELIKE